MNELEVPKHKYLDLENPQHFINLVPYNIREAILTIPENLFEFSEAKLITKVYNGNPPDDTDFELRLNFWEEYERCFEKCLEMSISKITSGVCSNKWFINHILENKSKLMFIISQPAKTQTRIKYAYHLSMLEMVRVLKMRESVNSKTGLVDTKLLEIKFRIFEYLDQKIHGSLIQRVEQKSLNVNVNTTQEELDKPQTAEEIDIKIQQLEQEMSFKVEPARPILTPLERTVIEAGNIVDEEFKRDR